MYTLKADWIFPVKKEVKDGGFSLGWSANTADWDLVTLMLGDAPSVNVAQTEHGFVLRSEPKSDYSPTIVVDVNYFQVHVTVELEIFEFHECDQPHKYADLAGPDYCPAAAQDAYLGLAQFLRRQNVPFEASMKRWEEFPDMCWLPSGGRNIVAYWAGKALGLY